LPENSVTTENGWALYGHPFFIERLSDLTWRVQTLIERDPDGFHHHPEFKLWESVSEYVQHRVPSDPSHGDYRQGSTLGKSNQHWFRVKKGLPQRYRLFFQFRSTAPKTIIYAWLNDETTLRKAGARTDVYAVFSAMLKGGKIPNSFNELFDACHTMDFSSDMTGTEEE
jgi:toxin YhaV